MGDLEKKLAKPVIEAIDDIAKKMPKALEAAHSNMAGKVKKAAEAFKKGDEELAAEEEHKHPHLPGQPQNEAGKADAAAAAAQKAAAEKAAAEAEKKAIEERINELRTQGHAPGRHLDPEVAALERRLGTTVMDGQHPKIKAAGPNVGHVASRDHVDPLTGTTTDGETGGPHRCGPYATKFADPADMAKVDQYCRDYISQHGQPPADIPIDTVLGPDGHKRLIGVYKDPTDPNTFLPVDFEGGSIVAPYRNDGGAWKLITMFPNPRSGRHP